MDEKLLERAAFRGTLNALAAALFAVAVLWLPIASYAALAGAPAELFAPLGLAVLGWILRLVAKGWALEPVPMSSPASGDTAPEETTPNGSD